MRSICCSKSILQFGLLAGGNTSFQRLKVRPVAAVVSGQLARYPGAFHCKGTPVGTGSGGSPITALYKRYGVLLLLQAAPGPKSMGRRFRLSVQGWPAAWA